MIDRDSVIATVRTVLDDHYESCVPVHQVLAERVADRLGLLEYSSPAPSIEDALRDVVDRDVKPENVLLDLGLWIDDAPKLVLSPAYLERFRSLPLSHLAVMVERSGGGLDRTWSGAQLAKLAVELPDHERVLTLWPEPSQAYLARLRLVLPGLLRAIGRSPRTGSFVVEFDLEGWWKRTRVSGFASLEAAGAALMRVVAEVAAELGAEIEVEVTTFPAHLEASSRGSVLGEKRLLLQTYAIAEVRGEKRAWDGPLGPERRPFEDVLRARAAAEPGVEVCAGLAAWEQADWPGEPEEAMALALESARRARVRRVRWWSSRHVIGSSANSYAAWAIETARPLSLRA